MQGRQRDEGTQSVDDVVVDQRRTPEVNSAMDHTVTDGIDRADRRDQLSDRSDVAPVPVLNMPGEVCDDACVVSKSATANVAVTSANPGAVGVAFANIASPAVAIAGTAPALALGVDAQLEAARPGVDDQDPAQLGQLQSRTAGGSSPCS